MVQLISTEEAKTTSQKLLEFVEITCHIYNLQISAQQCCCMSLLYREDVCVNLSKHLVGENSFPGVGAGYWETDLWPFLFSAPPLLCVCVQERE